MGTRAMGRSRQLSRGRETFDLWGKEVDVVSRETRIGSVPLGMGTSVE